MRRPLVVGVAVAAVLIALGLPFLRVELTRADPRVLGTSAEPRQVFELLRDGERFPPNEATPWLGMGNLEGGSPRSEPVKHGLPPEPPSVPRIDKS